MEHKTLRKVGHLEPVAYQRRLKVGCDGRIPGGRDQRIDGVLLLGAVHLLHVHRRAERLLLGMLGMLAVHAGVHAAVAVVGEERADGFDASLAERVRYRVKIKKVRE